jgi:hypothetical protein
MVTPTLFTSNYIVIGCLGKTQPCNAYDLLLIVLRQYLRAGHLREVVLLVSYHIFYRGVKRRDLLLRRYWRREDDGTYGSNEL